MNINSIDVPNPKSIFELVKILTSILTMNLGDANKHFALSLAATATLSYMAHKLKCDGAVMDKADLDILRRTRNINGPYLFVILEDQLHVDLNHEVLNWAHEPGNRFWLSERAKSVLINNPNLKQSLKDRCSSYVIREIDLDHDTVH